MLGRKLSKIKGVGNDRVGKVEKGGDAGETSEYKNGQRLLQVPIMHPSQPVLIPLIRASSRTSLLT